MINYFKNRRKEGAVFEINAKINFMRKIAVTMGDPLGIGPEIIVKALSNKEVLSLCSPIVIGDSHIIEKAIRLLKSHLKVKRLENAAQSRPARGVIEIMEVGALKEEIATASPRNDRRRLKPGPTAGGGKACYEYIKKAVELAANGDVDAICTGPISKEALKMAGVGFPGHTEMLASLTKTKEFAMMLAGGPLKVMLATTHAPLKDIPSLISREKVFQKILLAGKAGRMFGTKNPRIAVCGLNPHAGEGGAFGDEEKKIIRPAILDARRKGVNVTGPHPADSLFRKAYLGQVDIVIAMYHDQGLVPLKMIAFDTGVNITVGLPFIRTSPDHGTAYDIAWKGTADPQSMTEALKLAATLKPDF